MGRGDVEGWPSHLLCCRALLQSLVRAPNHLRTVLHQVMVKFVLYEEERSARIREEAAEYGDMVFVPSRGQIDYRSIVVKVGAGGVSNSSAVCI